MSDIYIKIYKIRYHFDGMLNRIILKKYMSYGHCKQNSVGQ